MLIDRHTSADSPTSSEVTKKTLENFSLPAAWLVCCAGQGEQLRECFGPRSSIDIEVYPVNPEVVLACKVKKCK